MIYIWVRTDVDWDDEAAFLAQCPPHMPPRLELWDATFAMPYRVFRGRVAKIAEASRAAVTGVECAPWAEIPDGATLLPVDDDDWFAPDVATTLEREWDGRAEGCSWAASFVEVPLNWRHAVGWMVRRRVPSVPLKYRCTTNNYAIVKRPELRRYAEEHMAATEWFERRGLPQIPGRLSVMNRSLASQTSLGYTGPMPSRAALVRRYEAYRRLYERPLQLPAWSAPYVARMAELMEELELR